MSRFRLLFVSDLHGSEVCYRKFLNSVPVYGPDLLVYGGDITGKILQPVFRRGEGGFRWYPSADRPRDEPEDRLASIERAIADSGAYPWVTNPEEWSELSRRPGVLEAKCREFALERARRWLALAGERLGPRGPPLVLNVGNDDTDRLLEVIRTEAPPCVRVPEGGTVEAGPYEIFGCGYANTTPWHCPRDLPEDELARVLDRTSSAIGDPRRTIFDIHAPPVDTAIDLAPQLDADRRPRTAAGEVLYSHVGSPSIRALIERVHPVASLHGHVHESKGADRVGATPVFNPGSVYYRGTLQGLVLDLDGSQVVNHLFVTG